MTSTCTFMYSSELIWFIMYLFYCNFVAEAFYNRIFSKKKGNPWIPSNYFLLRCKILSTPAIKHQLVFCFQKCSDLLREKNIYAIEKNFLSLSLKTENLPRIWDHENNVFEQWKVTTIFKTECFFNLFPEVSQIWYTYIRTIIIQIGKNNWDLKTCRKS